MPGLWAVLKVACVKVVNVGHYGFEKFAFAKFGRAAQMCSSIPTFVSFNLVSGEAKLNCGMSVFFLKCFCVTASSINFKKASSCCTLVTVYFSLLFCVH